MATNRKRILQTTESDDDPDQSPHFIFKSNETFPRFIVIQSQEEKAVTSLSPFVIEKQIESVIGTPKSVKKLKNRTLLVETSRKSQTDLLKMSTFFGIKVSVTEHKTLNSSKGVIRDRMLKDEKESEIVDYLKEQGVIGCKRFTIKKDNETIETNTLLLTFNSITVPKSLKIFYRIVPVDVYVPNPLRCFNCQSFGHYEDKCPADPGSVCANCGADGHSHHTSACKNSAKCVNCGKAHVSRSNQCEIWKKEKEIMKIKVTKNITYLEAKKVLESQSTDLDFSKIVHSLSSKPESKSTGTQFSEKDFTINPSSKVITPSIIPKSTSVPQSQSSSQSQSNSRPRSGSARSHSQSGSQSSSQSRSQSHSQSSSQSGTQSKPQKNNHRSSAGQSSSRGSNSGGSSSDRQAKGSNDPIKMANKYGVLDDMETT